MDETAVLAAAYAFRKALENFDQPEKSSLQLYWWVGWNTLNHYY